MLPAVTRPEPPQVGDDRAMLPPWLDYQRATLLWKCQMLEGDALVRRSVPPSPISLLGIVRHMMLVEWHWFERVFAATGTPEPFSTEEDEDADWNDLDPARAMEDIERFQRQCDISRGIVAVTPSMDQLAAQPRGEAMSLRWIMVHMIEEYARHNGHADFLRELIDGEVGE
ncbi:MAG TPA: DinB family protein [Acidimicrobiales bacterium]|nr:DinB family protein [Acidimicrobiales bacterium]